MLYPLILSSLAVFFLVAETLFPWRPAQRRLRKRFATDVFYFAFNGYVLGLLSFWLVWRLLWPALYPGLEYLGLNLRGYHGPAASWPLWVQIIAAVLALDLAQWLIHNLLHRSSWLWELHKIHHSIQDQEMDFLAAFRFHWAEALVYTALQLPVLLWLGFSGWAVFAHSVLGTLWNYVNHANLNLGTGAWRYLFNSPTMHLWHHDANTPKAVNFGVIFSLWDYLFGTAHAPNTTPTRLGFAGDTALPQDALGMSLWPLQKLFSHKMKGTPNDLRDQTSPLDHL